MSYSIYYNFYDKDYYNLTLQYIMNSPDILKETDEFQSFLENNENGSIEDFEISEYYDELRENYEPAMNYIHILQSRPSYEQMEMIYKYVHNCVIIELEELDVCAIALTGAGMDLSDNIELAYYIIDGVSPIKASQIMSLNEKAEELLMYCRQEKVVSFDKIKEFMK